MQCCLTDHNDDIFGISCRKKQRATQKQTANAARSV